LYELDEVSELRTAQTAQMRLGNTTSLTAAETARPSNTSLSRHIAMLKTSTGLLIAGNATIAAV